MDNHLLDIGKKDLQRPEVSVGTGLICAHPWMPESLVSPLSESSNHCLEVFDGSHAAFLEDPDRFEPGLRRFLLQGCETDFAPGN